MKLSDAKCRNAKPQDKPYKMTDGGGLYLLISKSGGKWWRFDYRYSGKRRTLSMGIYPDVSLKLARKRRDEAREQLAQNIDPGFTRKIEKSGNTFQSVADDFLDANAVRWSETHHRHIQECFARDVYPWLGARPIKEVSAVEVLSTLRRIVDRGALETAARTKQFIGQAIRYGIATGRADRDVTQDLRGALPSPIKGHFNAITDSKSLAKLLRDIDEHRGNFVVRTALQLQPMLFVRPANLVSMEWSEIDLDLSEWRIPANKMKMKDRHIVPLPRQAIRLLTDIKPLSGDKKFVFWNARDKNGEPTHISRETPGATLRRMGYTGIHTSHGFRTTASTILHEQGFHSDVIERQLAHAERNSVKAAYNHAQFLPERRRMLQSWADYLDSLRQGADVVSIHTTSNMV